MKTKLATIAALSVMVSTPAFAQNLVKNGSFEDLSSGSGFTSWILGGSNAGTAPVVIKYNQGGGYPDGAFGEPIPADNAISISPDPVGNNTAYFSSDNAVGQTISQTINLVAGQTYFFGFDYYAPLNGFNNPADATLSLLLNGVSVATTRAGSVSGTTPGKWNTFSSTYKATQNAAVDLKFSFAGLGTGGQAAADFAIDRVFAVAAPEPATWAMMIFGFGVAGGALRRRRSAGKLAVA